MAQKSDMLEIKVRSTDNHWVEVSEWIFRSWTGARRKNGKAYEGPVYYLGSEKVSQ